MKLRTARLVWAPSSGPFSQGRECKPFDTARSISRCQEGWKSTTSTRLPTRSWVFRTGCLSLASKPILYDSSVVRSAAKLFSGSTSTSGKRLETAVGRMGSLVNRL